MGAIGKLHRQTMAAGAERDHRLCLAATVVDMLRILWDEGARGEAISVDEEMVMTALLIIDILTGGTDPSPLNPKADPEGARHLRARGWLDEEDSPRWRGSLIGRRALCPVSSVGMASVVLCRSFRGRARVRAPRDFMPFATQGYERCCEENRGEESAHLLTPFEG